MIRRLGVHLHVLVDDERLCLLGPKNFLLSDGRSPYHVVR